MKAGYFLVELGLDGIDASIAHSSYLGIDRRPWRAVDEKYYACELSEQLMALRKHSMNIYVEGLSFGTLESLMEVQYFAEAFGDDQETKYQIIGARCLGSIVGDVDALLQGACEFGFDAYVDGYGSLLKLGYVDHPDVFEIFREKLNEYGLFSSLSDLKRYIEYYFNVASNSSLEIIDDSSMVLAYCITDIVSLK